MTADLLITPAELDALRRSDVPPRILDVRWRLDTPDGLPAYRHGHIPSAVYVSLDDDLAAHGDPADGRHPLPDPNDLQAAARRWGLNDGETVVVYDDWQSFAASRAWWALTDAGVADVRILDGGLGAWRAAGLPLEAGEPDIVPGTVTLGSEHLPRLDIDDVAAFAAHGLLLDVRAGERYRGENEPIDPRAGHIPGAVNSPATGSIGADGRFLDAETLSDRFAALGATPGAPAGVYCGSGVSATHTAVALRLAGVEAVLYPGSWSQWSNHPELPVATGDQP